MSRARCPARSSTTDNGVTIVGHLNMPGRVAASASLLYARNLYAFLETMVDKAAKQLAINRDDELVKATMLTDGGAVVHPNFAMAAAAAPSRLRAAPAMPGSQRRRAADAPEAAGRAEERRDAEVAAAGKSEGRRVMDKTALEQALDQLEQRSRRSRSRSPISPHGGGADAAGDAAHALSGGAIDPFVFRFAIFVLAIFVGYYVVWSVTPALHTPLMAVTNAISSVIVVGALLAVGISASGLATGFGFVALMLASVNIFGGFLVTQRMLAMYKKKEK